jgi:hypothetical protein
MTDEYRRVKEAIQIYEGSVVDELKGLKIKVCVDILFIILTFVLIFLAILYSNLAGLLTTLGFGGLTASSQGHIWVSTIKAYINDSSALRRGVRRLKEQLALCGRTDNECLDKVKCSIEKQFDALDKAAKK